MARALFHTSLDLIILHAKNFFVLHNYMMDCDLVSLAGILSDSAPRKVLTGASAKVPTAVKTRQQCQADSERIWKDQEIQRPKEPVDKRRTPEFVVLNRQRVSAEDVFFDLSENDGAADSCTELTVQISLPGALMKDISLDILEDRLICQTADYYLSASLPYAVRKQGGSAKWDKSRDRLNIELPIQYHVKYVTDPKTAYI